MILCLINDYDKEMNDFGRKMMSGKPDHMLGLKPLYQFLEGSLIFSC